MNPKPLTPQAAARAVRWVAHLEADIAVIRRHRLAHPGYDGDAARMEADITAIRAAIVAGVEPDWQALNFDPFYAETDIDSPMYAGGAK